MTSRGFRSFQVLCAIAACTAALAAQQQPAFKSGAKTVAIYATVTGKDARLVPDLVADDFEIKEDGKPRPISVFSNDVQPTVGLGSSYATCVYCECGVHRDPHVHRPHRGVPGGR